MQEVKKKIEEIIFSVAQTEISDEEYDALRENWNDAGFADVKNVILLSMYASFNLALEMAAENAELHHENYKADRAIGKSLSVDDYTTVTVDKPSILSLKIK